MTFMELDTFTLGPDIREVLQQYADRKGQRGESIEMGRIMSQQYGGRIAIPMPEVDKTERLANANFIAQGIDQHAMRVASNPPEITYPSLAPGKTRADDAVRTKRRVSLGWWEQNDMLSVDAKRARQLIAYGYTPVLIEPHWKTRQPIWQIRSPLETFPSTALDSLDMTPDDCIFAYRRSFGWMLKHYPQQAQSVQMSRKASDKIRPDDPVELIEYVDDTVRILISAGRGSNANTVAEAEYGVNGAVIINLGMNTANQWAVELTRTPNRAGVCPVVNPGRINLDNPKGQFDDAIGIFQMLSKMTALTVNSAAKSVWPDTWLIHAPNQVGQVVKVADGLRGVIGEVKGGDIKPVTEAPSPQAMNMINYLERALRLDGAMPAELGGESGSNIRTDRRGQSVLSAGIDYYIAEHQTVLARSKKHELERAQAIDLAYFGNTKKTFLVNWRGVPSKEALTTYRPKDLWTENSPVFVDYAWVGMDANAAAVREGQLSGLGAMSIRRIMELNPDVVKDPEEEEGRILAEQSIRAMMTQMNQPGAMTPPDIARFAQLVISGEKAPEAMLKVHEEAQTRQASSGPPGTPEGPVPPGSPAAQPGLAPPGAGAEQPTIAPVQPSLANYQGLLGELHRVKQAAQ